MHESVAKRLGLKYEAHPFPFQLSQQYNVEEEDFNASDANAQDNVLPFPETNDIIKTFVNYVDEVFPNTLPMQFARRELFLFFVHELGTNLYNVYVDDYMHLNIDITWYMKLLRKEVT